MRESSRGGARELQLARRGVKRLHMVRSKGWGCADSSGKKGRQTRHASWEGAGMVNELGKEGV